MRSRTRNPRDSLDRRLNAKEAKNEDWANANHMEPGSGGSLMRRQKENQPRLRKVYSSG
jgi:hypothetical protein